MSALIGRTGQTKSMISTVYRHEEILRLPGGRRNVPPVWYKALEIRSLLVSSNLAMSPLYVIYSGEARVGIWGIQSCLCTTCFYPIPPRLPTTKNTLEDGRA